MPIFSPSEVVDMELNIKLTKLAVKLNSLVIYRNFLSDPVITNFLDLVNSTASMEIASFYGKMYTELLNAQEKERFYTANAWKNHLLNLLIWDDNPGTRQAAFAGSKLSEGWLNAFSHDLLILEELFKLEEGFLELHNFPLLQWSNFDREGKKDSKHHRLTLELVNYLLSGNEWLKELDLLLEHYKKLGVGLFGQFHALYWSGKEEGLKGVANPDPISFSHLVGYEKERQQVIDNTLKFLQGYPANNVLLYGDRGTGKSSTVKALVNEYGDMGLRIVELKKAYLKDFPILIRKLSDLPYKFIIFLDDFSFEENEVEYKSLKAAFEGGLEAKPLNVLVYATSNRRHLVRESFSHREDDIHARDTVEEKMSLADRFGLQVAFLAPDQELYLQIVKELAKQRKINIDGSQLTKLALQWELGHSGRSGRLAKQFIDYLEGKDIAIN